MDLHQLHHLAAQGDFAGALEASNGEFGSIEANLEAACIAAWCLSRLERNDEALERATATFTAAETGLGSAHPVTLEALNDCARFAARSGLVSDAVGAGDRVLEMRRTLLGYHHPKTLTSWANLIGYRRQAGDAPSAEECQELLDAWQAADPAIADKAHVSARLLVAEVTGDISLGATAVHEYERLLGDDHPDTQRARVVLARLR